VDLLASKGTYRAGIIGHTGRGNYGHGLDLSLSGLPGVTVVAVSDPDEAGLAKTVEKTGAVKGYIDYREMLQAEKLDVVAVCPRRPDQRSDMLLAAIESGVKAIYSEKPFARSLAEADRVLTIASAHGVKIAVAHQNRAFPHWHTAKKLIDEGKIGRLRALKAFGKQDKRGGGQDLIVLGAHLLDLMRMFAGDARWCTARVCQDGHDCTPADVREGDEGVGLVMGDDVVAHYGFDNGITGSYESARADDGGDGNYFRLDFCGTGGIVTIWSSTTMPVYYYPRPFVLPDKPDEWQVIEPEALPMPQGAPEDANVMHPGNNVIVRDLLAALEENRKPLSSAQDARAALEMIHAVYASHIAANRISLPLEDREHPLATWS
jgi:predicted dehydrogenase